jgi:hypothetical protein
MTTASRFHRLGGWSVRCAGIAIIFVVCASAFAEPDKKVTPLPKQATKKTVKKVCYTYISGSGTPQPCDRLGTIPTTASPMDIVGSYPVERRR